jgi:hypothetical protein
MVLIDEDGERVDGDEVIGMVALDAIERGKLPEKTVVVTQMSNLGLDEMVGRLMNEAIPPPVPPASPSPPDPASMDNTPPPASRLKSVVGLDARTPPPAPPAPAEELPPSPRVN